MDQLKKEIINKGYEDVYVGKPELWSVLDESYPKEERVKKQLEIKDVRLQSQLYEQMDGLIKADQLRLKTTTPERIPAIIGSKYED